MGVADILVDIEKKNNGAVQAMSRADNQWSIRIAEWVLREGR